MVDPIESFTNAHLQIDTRSIWESLLVAKDQYQFFLHALLRMIEAYRRGEYTFFDAQTNTTCCHGIAVLASEILYSSVETDFKKVKEKTSIQLISLSASEDFSETKLFILSLAPELVDLVSLYVLFVGSEISKEKGKYTSRSNLKKIFNTSYKFRDKLMKTFQKYFSNVVSGNYNYYLSQIDKEAKISGVLTRDWGKYIQKQYIREDKRGVKYASYVLSMQILLSYLISKKRKVAVFLDQVSFDGTFLDRKYWLFEGDGKDNFIHISSEVLQTLKPLDFYHPTIVFSGFAIRDDHTKDSLYSELRPWLKNLTSLLLATNVQCPQFPPFPNDSTFDDSPIEPENKNIQDVLQKHKDVEGVSITNPSLFCLSHIFCSSFQEILRANVNKNLSYCSSDYIPRKLYASQLVK